MGCSMRHFLVALAVALACLAPAPRARAQTRPDSAGADSVVRRMEVKVEYDSLADSTTRRISAYAVVDTTPVPPDTFAVELSQRWRGRGTPAPVGPVELGLGRTRAAGLRGGRSFLGATPRRPAVVFVIDGARQVRLEQSEYASDAGRVVTFETAWYRVSPGDLRRIAESRELRVRVGDRELWIDPAWRRVAAEMLAGQGRPNGPATR
jgi:hypothetical protein